MKRTTLSAILFTAIALAEDHGPDPRLTGAPGDQTCASCHTGTALNAGGGSVAIELPNGLVYTPGVKQRITVRITDSTARRFGFQMTARLATDLQNGQAGAFAPADGNTQVMCDTGRVAPCDSPTSLQFAEHNMTGYRAASNTYTVDWTPPDTNLGPVRLYAAGNAANGNGNNTGDKIYTTSVELQPATSSPKPAISSAKGVVNGASFETAIAPNTWITITGTNLSSVTRSWNAAELAAGKLPASLDGVSVTINGKAAAVQYISPTQINAITPSDDASGVVELRVTSNGQTSEAATVNLQPVAPAFFTFDGKYLAATHADATLIGKSGLFAAAPTATTPAKPGETIILYGTGMGATSPAVESGTVTTAIAPLAATPRITIGGMTAEVAFGGLVPPFARLYQFNVVVPPALSDGDHPVVLEISGARTSDCCAVSVQR